MGHTGRFPGGDRIPGRLESAAFACDQFDVATLWHVLEHLPDPVGTLREVCRVLKPGGAVIVQVPNYASWQSRAFRDRWYGLDVPRHLHHFTPATLERTAGQAGLVWESLDHRSGRCNAVILASTLFGNLEPHAFARRDRAGSQQVSAKAFYLGLTWVLAPWVEVESLFRGGAVITAVARRPDTLRAS